MSRQISLEDDNDIKMQGQSSVMPETLQAIQDLTNVTNDVVESSLQSGFMNVTNQVLQIVDTEHKYNHTQCAQEAANTGQSIGKSISTNITTPSLNLIGRVIGAHQCNYCKKSNLYDYFKCNNCQDSDLCLECYQVFKIEQLNNTKGTIVHNVNHSFYPHQNKTFILKWIGVGLVSLYVGRRVLKCIFA